MRSPDFKLDQETGHFPFRACRTDRRFAYAVYIPPTYHRASAGRFRILVAIHGSERAPEVARALCEQLACQTGRVVLAPLFPVAMTDANEFHNYIFLSFGGIRYDQLLWDMVDEVVEQFGVSCADLWLSGFSGGGQFVHRFMYLYASRLGAVSVGAPGVITLLDECRPWPAGTRDLVRQFGRPVDWDGLRGLPVQVVVGADDMAEDILVSPGDPLYFEGVNEAGRNRVERAGTLYRALSGAGADCHLHVVPSASHRASEVQGAVNEFFLSAAERVERSHEPVFRA